MEVDERKKEGDNREGDKLKKGTSERVWRRSKQGEEIKEIWITGTDAGKGCM